jgi:mitochondrial cardiolipin hydrolase
MRFKQRLAAGVVCLIAGQLAVSTPVEARRRKDPIMKALEEKVNSTVEYAMVPVPKDEETCFSPDEPCDVKLLKFIDSAKVSIDVAIFDINLPDLVDHLLDKAHKIPVRIVVDKRQAKGEHSGVQKLVKGGASVRFGTQRGIMHNKFVIVDGKMVEIGSFNYTRNASKNNEENQIYLGKPPVVERYQKRFDKIWAKAKPVRESSRD